MPSHVAGKPDNSRGAADQARLPGVCLILPLHKEEARPFFLYFYCRLSMRGLTEGLVSYLIYRITVLVWFLCGLRFLSG